MSFGVWFKKWIFAFVNLLTFDYRKPRSDAQRKKERERRIKKKFQGEGLYHSKKKYRKRRSSMAVQHDKLFTAAMKFIGATLAIFLLPFGMLGWGYKRIKRRSLKSSRIKAKKNSPVTQSKKVHSTTLGYTYPSSEKKEKTNSSASAPASVAAAAEKIKIFEMPSAKVEDRPTVIEPDEDTPKSTPKHKNDQYIRKRMIIAGSSYCDKRILDQLKVGSYMEVVAEPSNPHDRDAIMLLYNGNKVGYIAKKEHLAHVTYLRLGRKIYAVITNVIDDTYPTRYEFETWFDMEK